MTSIPLSEYLCQVGSREREWLEAMAFLMAKGCELHASHEQLAAAPPYRDGWCGAPEGWPLAELASAGWRWDCNDAQTCPYDDCEHTGHGWHFYTFRFV